MKTQLETDLVLDELVLLSRSLGSETRSLAILAEGNVSAKRDEGAFWVKASGTQMGKAEAESFVLVEFEKIVPHLSGENLTDSEVRELLLLSRSHPEWGRTPSVETFMHAYLLQLPGVTMVGHTHPTALLSLLCLSEARELSKQRLFPDEVVCCGPESVFVPYTDPGLPLARAIQSEVESYMAQWNKTPKTIWLQNHGLIVLGRSSAEIESASLMSVKAAEVWLGALCTNRPISPMTHDQVARIDSRPDEHYRQKLLWQSARDSKI